VSDRFTARVIASVVLVMTAIIDVTSFFFSSAEVRHRPHFPLLLLGLSMPLLTVSAVLFVRSSKLARDEDDDDPEDPRPAP
jgi:hypothetical protein